MLSKAYYHKLGSSCYTQFANAEISGIVNNVFNTTYSPYGNGGASYSPIIALGESWAYHMGQFMADLRYGNNSSKAGEQLSLYSNGYIPSLSCHLVALENYDPTIPLSTYPFSWIPKGAYYDLIDARNDNTASPSYVALNDQASGYYTNQRLFNAFSSSITTLQAYRTNLLTQNSNNQSAFVNAIFTFYGY